MKQLPSQCFCAGKKKLKRIKIIVLGGKLDYSRTCPFGGNSRETEPSGKGAMCTYFRAVWCHITLPAEVMTLHKTQDHLTMALNLPTSESLTRMANPLAQAQSQLQCEVSVAERCDVGNGGMARDGRA